MALAENLNLISSTHTELPIIPTPSELNASGFCGHCTHVHIPTHLDGIKKVYLKIL